ncbi:hypothetical protein SEVIR_5G038501v4 [Setaria viridis]
MCSASSTRARAFGCCGGGGAPPPPRARGRRRRRPPLPTAARRWRWERRWRWVAAGAKVCPEYCCRPAAAPRCRAGRGYRPPSSRSIIDSGGVGVAGSGRPSSNVFQRLSVPADKPANKLKRTGPLKHMERVKM